MFVSMYTHFELSSNIKIVQSHLFPYIDRIYGNHYQFMNGKNQKWNNCFCKKIFLETQSIFALDSLKIEKKKKNEKCK